MVVTIAKWEPYAWLRHGFSTRAGGVSRAYSDGLDSSALNLGWTKEDDPANVVENRRRFAAAVGGTGARLVGVRQVHSAVVHAVRRDGAALTGVDGRPVLEGDGLTTDAPGLLLGVGAADCVPVLVADVRLRAVAAFHAGWRGTAARIVERGLAEMRALYGSQTQDLIAAVGPAIGPCCYAVGEEVRTEFLDRFAYGAELLDASAGQVRLNLWEANRRQLLSAGVAAGRIAVVGECTACARIGAEERRKYFSHRAEGGVTGRMLGAIGIAAGEADRAERLTSPEPGYSAGA